MLKLKIYGRTIPSLSKKELRDTGLKEWMKKADFISPKHYFAELKQKPYLEKLIKAGIWKLAKELMNTYKILEIPKSGELGKILGIDRFRMKRLRENDGGILYLKWLQKEKKGGRIIDDSVIRWFEKEYIKPEDIQFISNYMSEKQIKNYIMRQRKISKMEIKNLLSTWKDYLSMAKRIQLNVKDPIIYRTKELVKRHNEIVKIVKDKDLVLRAEEISEAFPEVNTICKMLKDKYEYEGTEYLILAPAEIEDILKEGNALQHCLNKSDTYFERINIRESYILFLRKKDKPEEPFYTLEVEPDGTVRQKRTEFDRQHADIEQAKEFLHKWQKQLYEKLTMEDFELAAQSKILRKKELDEMRKKKVRIHGGDYAGQLLADVLEADLMEVNAA